MPLRTRHWPLAFVLALVIHGSIGAALLWQPAADGAAQQAGTGGVEISLGPAGSAPGGEKNVTAEQPVEEPQQEPESHTPEPPVEQVEQPPPEPEPEPRPEPVVEQSLASIEPLPVPQPRQPPPTEAPSVAGAGGKSGNQESPNTGNNDADNTAGGGLPGSTANYMATLQAWLERHKEYPRRARLRHQEGTALLYFLMDRDGNVLQYRLHQSSGVRELDEEVLAMIERAQPLPSIPADMDKARLELVVPVEFFLRRR